MVIDLAMQIKEEIKQLITDRAELQQRVDSLTAERDRYRDMCGKMLDAAHEIHRMADACMPEGGKGVM